MTLILNGTDNSATTPAVTGTDTDTGVYYPAANQVGLATNGTLALLVNSAQDVGIGTTTPDIFTNAFARSLGVFSSGVGTTTSINVSGGAASRIQFGVGTTRYGLIYQDDTNFMQIATTTALPISFLTNNVERLRIPSNASGITFPATQVASADVNTLDDYEEGTFTPTVYFGGSQMGGGTLVTQATYTKIGRAVYYLVDVTISTLGTGSGSMQIRGMPFQVTSGTNAYACPAGHSEGLQSAISNFLPLLPPGTTYFDMYYNWNGTAGPSVFAYSNCKSGSGFRLTGLYFTS